jgi:ADP-heptose:LPS heptosyltransferase
VALARHLLAAHPDLSIVFIGTPAERTDTESLCAEIASPRVATLAGRTTLRELFTLFTLADIVVTNDSGPAHFAALTDIEIVAMYGPETPLLFGPLGPHVHLLHHAIACSPCLNVFNHRVSPCRDNVCIQLITVEEVAAAVEDALAARA